MHTRSHIGGWQGAAANSHDRVEEGAVQAGYIIGQQAKQGLVQEALAERLRAAGTQGYAAHNQLPLVSEQGIVFHFVAEHGAVASLVLKSNACWQVCADLRHQFALLLFAPVSRHREIDTVCISLY